MVDYKRLFFIIMASGIMLLLVDHSIKWGIRTSEFAWHWVMVGAAILAAICAWLSKPSRK